MTCRECVPGELQCNRQELVRCSDDKKWELVQDCATASLCQASIEEQLADPERPVACVDPVCEVGRFKCSDSDGRTLLGCPPHRDAWRVVGVCATPELCQAESGRCVEPTCLPGEYRCSGPVIEVCSPDGTRFEMLETCAEPGQCSTAERTCVSCTPGAMQCSGRELQRCSDTSSWERVDQCASAALCVVDATRPSEGYCDEPACSKGEFRCRGEHLESCDAERDGWDLVATCSSADVCNSSDGRCDVPGCPTAGAHRCRGAELERCADDRSGWQLVQSCDDGTACDLESRGCAAACPSQGFRCNGKVPEACLIEADGRIRWRAVAAPCATDELCRAASDAADCQAPLCGGALARFRCDPDNPLNIQRCADGRDGWITTQSCSSGSVCDPGAEQRGPAQCDICDSGTWSCDNGVLSRCRQDGQRDEVLETCRDAEHCVVSDAKTDGYCLRCDEGRTQCGADDNLLQCSEDRRSWVPAETCDSRYGCHDEPDGNDYCYVCAEPEESRCEGDDLAICDDQRQRVTERRPCRYGCESIDGDDYCRECEANVSQCLTDDPRSRRVCGADGLWRTQMCPDAALCHEAGNADYCGSCEPGTVSCFSDRQQQECAMSGTPGSVRDCPSEAPVCLAATGQCVECIPGAAPRCTGSQGDSGRAECGADGFWHERGCSGDTPICDAGRCRQCVPSSVRCTGGNPKEYMRCSSEGRWQTSSCLSSDVCWEGQCVACNPMTAAPRCTQSGGPAREVCVDGQWQDDSCGGGVCVGGECMECDPGTHAAQCMPDTDPSARRACRDGSWIRDDCRAPTPMCEGEGRCACEEGGYRCAASGRRQRCTGGAWVDDACATGQCRDGECVECIDDRDCSSALPLCVDGACVCSTGGERCSSTGAHQTCAGGSWQDDPCAGDTPLCDAASGRCVCSPGATRCSGGDREECTAGEWLATGDSCTPCSSDAACGGVTPICDGVECVACDSNCPGGLACARDGACVQCTLDDARNCGGDTPVCSADDVCVECTAMDARACVGRVPVCDDNVCRGCDDDDECGEGYCDVSTGECLRCRDSDGAGCVSGEVCFEGRCVECLDDSDCDAAAPICRDRQCRGCSDDSECVGQCLASGECAECGADSDCPAGIPNCESGRCRACEVGACGEGVCNLATGACEPCAADNCSGYCDDAGCEACTGLLCPDGRVCMLGECLSCGSPDGGAGVTCPSGICLAGICL